MVKRLWKACLHRPKLCTLLCFLLIQFSALHGTAQMRAMYYDTVQSSNDIRGISFYSPSSGYVGFRQWIGFTTDSGKHFTRKYVTYGNTNFNGYFNVNLTFGFGVSGVHAFSQDTVIAYGDFGFVPSILYSTNGGSSWTLVYHGPPYNFDYPLTNGVTDMVFPENNNVGYAVQFDRILKTNNRGRTWTVSAFTPNSFFTALEAVDNNTVFAIASDPSHSANRLLKTSNAGSSWQDVNMPPGQIMWAYFLTVNKGWIAMNNGGNSALYYSSNGGINWTRKTDVLAQYDLEQFRFINDSTGYAIGNINHTYKTTDSGRIWERLPRDNDFSYLGWGHNDIHFRSDNQFWAGGGHGFLEMTTNGGGLPYPRAYFRIDTTGLSATNVVNLLNHSKTSHQFKWYKNDTLISTSYHASYIHNIHQQIDTIMLIATNATGSDTSIQYQYFNLPPPPPVPTLTSFSPTTGYAGNIVTINGTNFIGTTAVSFGGVPASSFNVVSNTRINAVVGSGASGNVSITTPYGTASLGGFTFATQMKITSFTPASGPVGTSVIITGINFSPVAANNIVHFGKVAATVTSASATQLVATVPVGATYDPVSVTINGISAYSAIPFVVTFPDGGPITPDLYPERIKLAPDNALVRIETADIDGDGKLDLITANSHPTLRLAVLRNTSSGDAISFANAVYATIGSSFQSPGPFTVGDVNGDGKLDLVASNNPGGGFTVFRNTSTPGSISFSSTVINPSGLSTVHDIVLADFEGDGKPDVFVSSANGTRILQNTGTLNTISFNMLAPFNGQGTNFSRFRASDVDGDGKTDLVVNALRSGVRTLIVHKNNSNGNNIIFTPVYFTSNLVCERDLYVGDLDMDGLADVAMVDAGNNILAVFRNTTVNGVLSFAPRTDVAASASISGLRITDLNGDGKPDLGMSVATFTQTPARDVEISLVENNSTPGTLSFGNKVEIALDNNFGGLDLVLGDWNNDHKPDAAIVRDSLSIYPNRAGTFIIKMCDAADSSITSNLSGSTYQWQEDNGSGFVNISDNSNFSGTNARTLQLNDIPASFTGRKYRSIVDGNASSYIFKLKINAYIVPSVTIHGPAALCQPQSTPFTARAVNGGEDPQFQWILNGINVVHGVNVVIMDDSLLVIQPRNGDQLQVVMTSNAMCVSNATANAVQTLSVEPYTFASVSISASSTSVCNGAPVTFTANVLNVGADPTYQWYRNNLPVGTDTSVYVTSDMTPVPPYYPRPQIHLIVRNGSGCSTAVQTFITSNTIYLDATQVNSTVSIAGQPTAACPGAPTAFIAQHVNGGNNPSFQWQVNGVNVGTNSNKYIHSAINTNDQVRVIMTGNNACSPADSDTSFAFAIPIQPYLVPTVSISSNGGNCQGGSVTFTATTTNSGTHPSYQWQVNGVNVGTNSTTFTSSSLNNGDQVKLIMFSSEHCATPGMVTSNVITVNGSGVLPVATISTPLTTVCAGANVTFTANITNAGNNPVYQWMKNGVNVGSNSNTYTSNAIANGDVITLSFTSTTGCSPTPVTVNSNAVTMSVTGTVTPTVSIAASATTICAGASVTFTATPVNGGTNPSYQWQVNGANAGNNSNTFTTTSLANNDQVSVIMTSNAGCLTTPTTVSNVIGITVTPNVTPVISVSTPATTVCAGTNVTFTAAVVNMGTSPVYQWKKNGVNVGTNSNTYTTNALANGDIITASITSNTNCSTAPVTVSSNAVIMTITNNVTPSVSITSAANTICAGQSVTFTATATNGGTNPAYQWKVNGTNVGTNANTYTTTNLANNDVVSVTLTSNATCLSATTANSNAISMTVNPVINPVFTIAGNTTVTLGTSITLTAGVTNAGSNYSLQWQDSTNTHNWQNIAGATGQALNYAPLLTGDAVRATLTVNSPCANPSSITTSALVFTVLPDGRVPNGPFGVLYYPNPATTVLVMDSLRLEDKWETLEIMSLSGEHKMRVMDVRNKTKVTVYIGGLPNGMYVAVLRRSSGAPGHYRFIKR